MIPVKIIKIMTSIIIMMIMKLMMIIEPILKKQNDMLKMIVR